MPRLTPLKPQYRCSLCKSFSNRRKWSLSGTPKFGNVVQRQLSAYLHNDQVRHTINTTYFGFPVKCPSRISVIQPIIFLDGNPSGRLINIQADMLLLVGSSFSLKHTQGLDGTKTPFYVECSVLQPSIHVVASTQCLKPSQD